MKKLKLISVIVAVAFCFIGGLPNPVQTASAEEVVIEQSETLDALQKQGYQTVYS